MTVYYRPIPMADPVRPDDAVTLAGGWCWFSHAERFGRDGSDGLVPVGDIPDDVLETLCAPRADVAGLTLDAPRLMGILNVTPDSFSDGGQFARFDTALAQAETMAAGGADILDIGGESTRPGAEAISAADEIARVIPVIKALQGKMRAPVSIDTRKAEVARTALKAGASMLNDVAALSYDADMAALAAASGAPICLMHAQGDPKTMQQQPHYDNVLLDVYDYLAGRIALAMEAGIARSRIIVDPGIGFGKTVEHNLTLLRHLSLFHGLGCPILLGASRKRFIGTLGNAPDPMSRAPGSIAVALAGVAQGVQILRVHDIEETRQALTLWQALGGKRTQGS